MIVTRTILRPATCVMDAAFRPRSDSDSHVQRPDCKVAFHLIANCPTDNAQGVQIQDHGQIQPAFAHPNIADIACPFLVRRISREVPIQQVQRNFELVVAVGRELMLTCSQDQDAALAHQTAHAAVTDVQTNLFQLLSHACPAMGVQAHNGSTLKISLLLACGFGSVQPMPLADQQTFEQDNLIISQRAQTRSVQTAFKKRENPRPIYKCINFAQDILIRNPTRALTAENIH